ncbi:TPA: Tc toxin subunit A [Salmonella enterica]
MSISASPALKQVESRIGIPVGSLAKKNYHSVFDVIRQSRKQFAIANASWLGSRGGHTWDLAMGQAQYIRRLFRESRLTQQVREALPRTLSGHMPRKIMSPGGVQGLVQNGPNWQNQFGEYWQAYCQSGSPEAYDSPVSYLTWLYNQALSFEKEMDSAGGEIISLSERRPDLATMVVNNDAVNQEIPALQLVNEILENNITTTLGEGNTVDKTLAVTHYPTLLPYHFPHDQVELSLLNAGVPLEDIIGETSTDWPWFLKTNDLKREKSNNATEIASRLAPEQQTIITEPAPTDSGWEAFYKANLGLDTPDYSPFEDLSTFTHQLGITAPQTEQLIAGNAGGTTVALSPNITVDMSGGDLVTTVSTVTGKFKNALSLYNQRGSYAWFVPNGIAATTMKGDKSFSISMWINVSAQPTDRQMPIICNCLLDGINQGMCITINNGKFKLTVTDSANKTDSKITSTGVKYNTWYFMCLTWDSATRTPCLYYQAAGESTISTLTLDNMTTVTEDITTANGFTWVLNDSGDFSYYDPYPTPNPSVNCLYDDMAVFTGVLTQADAQLLASSTTPLPQVTELSLKYKSYYSLDAVDYAAASENYGASFINAHVAPAIQSALSISTPTVTELGTNVSNGGTLALSTTGNTPYHSKGLFSDGVCFYNTTDSYGYLTGNAKATLDANNNLSAAFWLKISDTPSANIPIFSNNLNDKTEPGFTLLYTPENSLTLGVSDNSGGTYFSSNVIEESGSAASVATGVWYFICLSWDSANKVAYIYYAPQHGSVSTIKVDCASATGSFAIASGMEWTFNNYGNFSYYSNALDGDGNVAVIVDDISLYWKEIVTEEEVQAIVTKQCLAADANLPLTIYHEFIFNSDVSSRLLNLSNDRMDRINRMVRLQRWLGLTYEEADLLLSACNAAQGAYNTDFNLNTHTLRALGVFRHWQQKYGMTAFQFAAVLHQITPYAISPAIPFLDQVFNGPSLFEEPFAITGETINYTDVDDSSSSRVVKQLCAGLGLTQAQFRVLADKVGDNSAHTFPLTLDSVSAFYRLALIPRWLGLSFAEGAALFSLVGQSEATWTTLAKVPQLATLSGTPPQPTTGDILDTLMELDAAADWAKEHGLSWVKNYLELQPAPETLTATAATANFVNSIKQQLPATLLSEQSFVNIPQPSPTPPVAFTCPEGWSGVPGIINGSAWLLNSAKKQYGQFTDDANTLADGSKGYSLGFWVNIPATTTTSIPVAASGGYNKQGIFISKKDSSNLQVTVYDDTGATVYDDTGTTVITAVVVFPSDTWFYLALTLDITTKKLMVYTSNPDGTVTSGSLDYSSLTGTITTAAGNAWRLNEDGVNTFYRTYGNNHAELSYDDVTLWNSVLTETNIIDIVKSGKIANETVPATIYGKLVSSFTSWMDMLSNLVSSEGLVLPAAKDYNNISSLVQADTTGLFFDAGVDADQVDETLSGMVYQAMLSQNGIADSALAQQCNTQQALSSFLFRWASDSEHRLLSDTLVLNNGDTVTDLAVITADATYLPLLYALEQRAEIASQFSLTPAALSTFLTHPTWLDTAYTVPLSLSLSLLHRLSRYNDWLKLAIKEGAVLAYLTWVNGSTPTPPDAASAAKALSVLLSWEASEVEQAAAELPDNVLIAKTVADVDYVMRLQRLSEKTGLSVTPLQYTGKLVLGNAMDTWDKWQAAGESLVAAQTENK